MAKKWEGIILHCSASNWGSAAEIRKWHLKNNWSDVGYHFIVGNGLIRPNFNIPIIDGAIEVGRTTDGDQYADLDEAGAHTYGFNSTHIGVCMIGNNYFSGTQVAKTVDLIQALMKRFDIPIDAILGHYELDVNKTCPNMNMDYVRELIWPNSISKLK